MTGRDSRCLCLFTKTIPKRSLDTLACRLRSAMSTEPKKVPPFFCQASPPDPLPLLTSQMTLGEPVRPATILANEELPILRTYSERRAYHAPAPVSTASAPDILSSSSSAAISCQGEPIDIRRGGMGSSSTHGLRGDVWRDQEETSGALRRRKIPKPTGEVGRPGSGGYNLRAAMGWDDDDYERLRVCLPFALPNSTQPCNKHTCSKLSADSSRNI